MKKLSSILVLSTFMITFGTAYAQDSTTTVTNTEKTVTDTTLTQVDPSPTVTAHQSDTVIYKNGVPQKRVQKTHITTRKSEPTYEVEQTKEEVVKEYSDDSGNSSVTKTDTTITK